MQIIHLKDIKYVDNTPEGFVVINNNNNLERKNIKKNLSIDNDEIKKIAGKLVQRNKNIEFPNLNKYKNKNDILKTNNDNNIERKNKKIKEITVDLSQKKNYIYQIVIKIEEDE